MRLPLFIAGLIGLSLSNAAPGQSADRPTAGFVRVRLVTSAGPIVLALDARHAPATTANFLAYVDDRRFDGIVFYRAARSRLAPKFGYIQGGIRTDPRRILPPFPHEPTTRTGIHHLDGTISMARRAEPNSAGGNFFITVGPMPSMDATATAPGYAAFGRVVAGMPVVKRILAAPTQDGAFKGQMIVRPITILTARRLDGKPRPTGRVKSWLVKLPPKR
ncbi:peptidylprolyl isomerase [Sphingomonas sp. Leaf17]|uniref:peptidylprolyl isomerase n=1 Tax=Sphingomonas sp. Leaf17 TaxID=1735683 RepID=UPI0006F51480|nr:peptidylprolyl isomerase [Sphingomonas sp. Leaf17]KQM64975.1 peptidylprolyl isomerase [Sphingomonas sp. Leaf17]